MQTKLRQWAIADPGRCFDDLFNLVYDPAFLTVAWRRVRGNKDGGPGPRWWDPLYAPHPTITRSLS
jgi:hypothetical protein